MTDRDRALRKEKPTRRTMRFSTSDPTDDDPVVTVLGNYSWVLMFDIDNTGESDTGGSQTFVHKHSKTVRLNSKQFYEGVIDLAMKTRFSEQFSVSETLLVESVTSDTTFELSLDIATRITARSEDEKEVVDTTECEVTFVVTKAHQKLYRLHFDMPGVSADLDTFVMVNGSDPSPQVPSPAEIVIRTKAAAFVPSTVTGATLIVPADHQDMALTLTAFVYGADVNIYPIVSGAPTQRWILGRTPQVEIDGSRGETKYPLYWICYGSAGGFQAGTNLAFASNKITIADEDPVQRWTFEPTLGGCYIRMSAANGHGSGYLTHHGKCKLVTLETVDRASVWLFNPLN